jgi:SHS2 domain-containing protein
MPFSWGDHVGELELRMERADERGVFDAGLQGLRELLGDEDERSQPSDDVVAVRVEGSDRAGLLAAWLEELNYLAESEGLIPMAAQSMEVGDRELRAQVRVRRGHPPHLVKAVTYHRLAFEPTEGGWRAVAVLDV